MFYGFLLRLTQFVLLLRRVESMHGFRSPTYVAMFINRSLSTNFLRKLSLFIFSSMLKPQPPAKPSIELLAQAPTMDNNRLEKLVKNFVVEDKARLAAARSKAIPSSIQFTLQKFERNAQNDAGVARKTPLKTNNYPCSTTSNTAANNAAHTFLVSSFGSAKLYFGPVPFILGPVPISSQSSYDYNICLIVNQFRQRVICLLANMKLFRDVFEGTFYRIS